MRFLYLFYTLVLCFISFGACASKNNTLPDFPNNPALSPAPAAKLKLIDINLTFLNFAFGVDPLKPDLKASVNNVISSYPAELSAIAANYFDPSFTPFRLAVPTLNLPDTRDDCIVVAVNAQIDPFEFQTDKGLSGVNIEIASFIADKLGKNLILYNTFFEDIFTSVGGSPVFADLCVSAFPSVIYDDMLLDSTLSHYSAGQVVIVREKDTLFDSCSTATEVEEILNNQFRMRGKKAGFQADSIGERYVLGDLSYDYKGFEFLQSLSYPTAYDALIDLSDGIIDFVFLDKSPANVLIDRVNSRQSE